MVEMVLQVLAPVVGIDAAERIVANLPIVAVLAIPFVISGVN
jgi:hypothetical protein